MISTPRDRGLTVAVLGPDGSGKSTVLEAIVASPPAKFSAARVIHFRPSVGRRHGDVTVVTDPHGKEPRGPLMSTVKLLYYFGDYLLGQLITIRPAHLRGELVLFDRHYVDLLVDPRRFRFGGPVWLTRLVGRLVPQPDLIILLDAPTEVLQARKCEVPFGETARQGQAYRAICSQMSNALIVDANRPVDEIATDVRAFIAQLAGDRVRPRPSEGAPA